jgi:hypothetical protein
MPTPDEELDAMLAGAPAPAGNPDAELDAMLAGAPKAPAEPKPVRAPQPDANGAATGRGLDAPVREPTWYERLTQAGLNQEKSAAAARANLPKTAPVESRYADVLQHGSAEDAARLYGGAALNFAGQALAGAAPVSSIPGMVASSGAGAGLSGAGASLAEGDPLEDVAKHGTQDALDGAGLAALLGVGVKGAAAAAPVLKKKANEVLTHVFMTPAQRTAYRLAKGKDSLVALGQASRDAGLTDRRGALDLLRPVTARRMAENAESKMATTGHGMGAFEDDLSKRGLDVNVDYRPITDKMRADADFVAARSGTNAPRHAAEIRAEADSLQPAETQRRWLPREMPAEQTSLDLPEGSIGNRAPAAPQMSAPEQMSLPGTERQGGQMALDFGTAPEQQSLQFGPGTNVPSNQPLQGELANRTVGSRAVGAPGAVQPSLANDASWDAANAGPAAQSAPAAEQLSMPVASQQQMFPDAPQSGVTQWSPGSLEGEQAAMSLSHQPERFEDLTRPRPGRPFHEAIADKRQFANEIKWNKGAQTATMGQDAAQKAAWSGLSDQIGHALDAAAARGEITQDALQAYRQNSKDFSTSAAVFDPALRMAEKHGQSGLSAGDLLAATAAGGGVDGGLAVLANKGTRGTYAGAKQGALYNAGGAAEGAAEAGKLGMRAMPAIQAAARENPGAPKSQVEEAANAKTKKALKGWWEILTGVRQ